MDAAAQPPYASARGISRRRKNGARARAHTKSGNNDGKPCGKWTHGECSKASRRVPFPPPLVSAWQNPAVNILRIIELIVFFSSKFLVSWMWKQAACRVCAPLGATPRPNWRDMFHNVASHKALIRNATDKYKDLWVIWRVNSVCFTASPKMWIMESVFSHRSL